MKPEKSVEDNETSTRLRGSRERKRFNSASHRLKNREQLAAATFLIPHIYSQ